MGSRRLREWIGAPLLDLQAIADRQDAVEAFVAGGREEAREALRPVADLERLCARVVQGTASPRDLAALRFSLEALPALGGACRAPALARRIPEDLAPDVAADIAAWLVDEPPALTGDGGYIRDGADEALDRVRGLALDARGAIARMEDALRAETGVASLKIRYNSVFGYYIEVTKANLHRVPGRWHRKQTIATGERFITPELKEYEEQVAGAESRRVAMEAEFLLSLRARVGAQVGRLQALARAVGELDVFAALAEVAARWRWTRPEVDRGDGLELRAARHPVVEAARREERFVPNDLALDENSRLIILTGPNMAGKSTLMRQAALAVVLAQVGSFVPAQRARVGLVDRLFVRVGASDDLAKGQSTFMVEMSETANILASATSRSLVLLDEIGRGTATYDGVAIAWAVAEDLHDRVRCRGVFATHYHELAALTESCMRVRNFHVAVSEHQERVVFLRKVRPGPASGSYGIQCARLAGLPRPVVQRAGELLKQLERRRPRPEATQLSLFGAPAEPVAPPPAAPLSDPIREAVAGIDPDVLTPREALDALYRLRRLLDE
jgi:DNA mismatch repair protein MutS